VIRHFEIMKAMPTIAIVEDDNVIARLVEKALRLEGFRTAVAGSGAELDRLLNEMSPDLILLDIMLPGESGLDIAKRVTSVRAVPIIMVTALGEEDDRIKGLDLGADDYIVKPFSTRELVSRIRAVLRRADSGKDFVEDATLYSFAGFTLNCMQRRLTDARGGIIEITDREFRILQAFCRNPRRTLTRERLLMLINDRATGADDRSIDTALSRLRNKIELEPKFPELIKTVRLGGYMFTPDVLTADTPAIGDDNR
jgi:two-component system, OmpR family, response regulator